MKLMRVVGRCMKYKDLQQAPNTTVIRAEFSQSENLSFPRILEKRRFFFCDLH